MRDERIELEQGRSSEEHDDLLAVPGSFEEPSFVVLESGRIRFYVRPRVEVLVPASFSDIQRFTFTLAPRNREVVRRVSVGKKRMPDDRIRERQWAWIDRVGPAAHIISDLGPKTYPTKTRGVRHQAGVIEVARGTYAITSHRDHTHLLYELESSRTAEVNGAGGNDGVTIELLRQLRVVPRASYIAAVFNPESKWRTREPADADVPFREPSIYDDALMARFGKRRFAPLDPAFLEHEGAELVLIGGGSQRLDAVST
jgi:hypothetical protein